MNSHALSKATQQVQTQVSKEPQPNKNLELKQLLKDLNWQADRNRTQGLLRELLQSKSAAKLSELQLVSACVQTSESSIDSETDSISLLLDDMLYTQLAVLDPKANDFMKRLATLAELSTHKSIPSKPQQLAKRLTEIIGKLCEHCGNLKSVPHVDSTNFLNILELVFAPQAVLAVEEQLQDNARLTLQQAQASLLEVFLRSVLEITVSNHIDFPSWLHLQTVLLDIVLGDTFNSAVVQKSLESHIEDVLIRCEVTVDELRKQNLHSTLHEPITDYVCACARHQLRLPTKTVDGLLSVLSGP